MADTYFMDHMDEGGWGVAPDDPVFQVTNGNAKATLAWIVPAETKVGDQVVCHTAGVKILRKTTGYPTDEWDGDVVVDSLDLAGTYSDTGLTNGNTYYYRCFAYSDHKVYNRCPDAEGSATPSNTAKVRVVFQATEAIGEVITAKRGSTTLTATVTKTAGITTKTSTITKGNGQTVETTVVTGGGSAGVAEFSISTVGDWVIGGQTVTVSELGEEITLEEKMYGYDFILPPGESNPESIVLDYPSGVDNANFDPVGTCGADADISVGDWQEFVTWLGARPVMLNFDGTVAAELDHSDQTKNLDGTASSVADSSTTQNAMVEFPKRYMKRWTTTDSSTGNTIGHFRIARLKLGDDWKCYPWLYGDTEDTAVENDEIYMPMFEGSSISSKVRSLSGKTPMNTQTGATEYTQITALGDGWQFDDWSDAAMITDFMFMMAKSTNVQTHWGYGHYSGGSQASSLHSTGALVSHGPFYGGTGNTNMKFLWMENWYGDRWERTFGVWYISSVLYVKNFPPYTTDGTVTNYTNLGRGIGGTSGGYISAVTYDENGMIPQTVSGSDSTYIPDGCWFSSGTMFLLRGAKCSDGLRVGAAFYVDAAFSYSSWNIGPSPAFKKTHAA